jgi:23S rRNA (adenine2030-N6)-methyltransferase
MLSYQHIYHAGNFADIHKHAILAQVIKAMRTKPQPMAVLDTHAGRGVYDLSSVEAEKNREFDNGITHFWPRRAEPSLLRPFLEIVETFNTGDSVTQYPGSSMIARRLLKPADRLVAVERHPGEVKELQTSLAGLPQTTVVQEDGLQTMLDNVPFPERRGLVIIDPSYEIKTDYADVPKHIALAFRKWPQGSFLLWYPIMNGAPHRDMFLALKKSGVSNMLISEICLEKPPEDHFRMYGSGIAIVNPPWPDAILKQITEHITMRMPAATSGEVFWLDNLKFDEFTGKLL